MEDKNFGISKINSESKELIVSPSPNITISTSGSDKVSNSTIYSEVEEVTHTIDIIPEKNTSKKDVSGKGNETPSKSMSPNADQNMNSSMYEAPTFEDLFPDLAKKKHDILYYANPKNIFHKKNSLKDMEQFNQICSPPSVKPASSASNTGTSILANIMKTTGLTNNNANSQNPAASLELTNTGLNTEEIKQTLNKMYQLNHPARNNSNALDILAIYIRGQKILYTEAKTYCEQQLNFLMLPAIFISCLSSIFSFVQSGLPQGTLIMAGLNGFNAFLLSLISYLKLDAKAQAHKTSAYKFDKLESMCEFNSGKFMFFEIESTKMVEVILSIEMEVKEIKETNQFILPESIRHRYPITYSTNIFAVVKKLQSVENTCIESLTETITRIRELNEKIEKLKFEKTENLLEINQTIAEKTFFEQKRENLIGQIFYYRQEYFNLDDRFNKEIKANIKRQNRWFITRIICCDWLKS
jgi:hypothetical protein